jgi:hypothetical protein
VYITSERHLIVILYYSQHHSTYRLPCNFKIQLVAIMRSSTLVALFAICAAGLPVDNVARGSCIPPAQTIPHEFAHVTFIADRDFNGAATEISAPCKATKAYCSMQIRTYSITDGQCVTLGQDWNDRASSFKTGDKCTLYADNACSGTCKFPHFRLARSCTLTG